MASAASLPSWMVRPLGFQITEKALRRAYDGAPLYTRATNPRWKSFLRLFDAVDAGHPDLGIERGYNGNLFKPDPEIDNLRAVLRQAGTDLKDVVKTTVFLTSLDDFQGMNSIYAERVGDTPPARSTVEIAGLPSGALVEIEAVALL